jgi:hypothetical protein
MASNSAPKTILLSGDPSCYEGVANAAITPGHLIETMSTGKLRVHATAAGVASAMFAREEEYVGGGIDTAYAADDQVPYWAGKKGDHFYALVAAAAAAIANGAMLESAGDGTLRNTTHAVTNATTAAAWPIAKALEAVDNSGGGAPARIKVEVL